MVSKIGVIVLILIAYLITACQTEPDTQPLSTPSPEVPTSTVTFQVVTVVPTATKTSTANPTQEPTQEEIPTVEKTVEPIVTNRELTEELLIPVDELNMAGTLYFPSNNSPPWPGVILLHMLHGDQSQWEDFPQQLTEEGFAVLSMDIRGHGNTGGEMNWDLAISDQQQVWNYFAARQEIDQDQIAFVGASVGANLALVASSNEPSVRTAVLLSPGLNYAGVKTQAAINSIGDRPVLIVASQEDTYAADSSTILYESAVADSQLIMYQEAGHGTFMFRAEPGLTQAIADWLATYLE